MLPISIISLLAFYVCALEPPFPQAVVQGMAQLSYLPSLINTSQSFTEISPAELAAFLTSASTDTTDPKSEHVPEHDNRNDQWTFRRLRLSRVTSRYVRARSALTLHTQIFGPVGSIISLKRTQDRSTAIAEGQITHQSDNDVHDPREAKF